MFVGLHVALAGLTKNPELEVTEQEGVDFMKSAQNVMRHYSVETTQKTLDWIAFMGVSATMYGTRAIAIFNRHAEERQQKRPKATVTPIRNAASQRTDNSPSPPYHMPDEPIIPNLDPDAA